MMLDVVYALLDAGIVAEEDIEEPDPPCAEPPEQWPSLEEYKEKWTRKLQAHSSVNHGPFSHENLVPELGNQKPLVSKPSFSARRKI